MSYRPPHDALPKMYSRKSTISSSVRYHESHGSTILTSPCYSALIFSLLSHGRGVAFNLV
jgi:hypothetical protein